MPKRKPYTKPTVRTPGPWENLGKKNFDWWCDLTGTWVVK